MPSTTILPKEHNIVTLLAHTRGDPTWGDRPRGNTTAVWFECSPLRPTPCGPYVINNHVPTGMHYFNVQSNNLWGSLQAVDGVAGLLAPSLAS
jgi:hypothetical protein